MQNERLCKLVRFTPKENQAWKCAKIFYLFEYEINYLESMACLMKLSVSNLSNYDIVRMSDTVKNSFKTALTLKTNCSHAHTVYISLKNKIMEAIYHLLPVFSKYIDIDVHMQLIARKLI